jgi:hypothetical protein
LVQGFGQRLEVSFGAIRAFSRARPTSVFGFEKEKKKARAAKPTLVVVAVGIFFRGREWSSPPG